MVITMVENNINKPTSQYEFHYFFYFTVKPGQNQA